MTPIDLHLLDIADAHGITIEYVQLRDDRDGQYIHSRQLICLRPGMPSRLHRSVLAHELGHAAFADVPSRFGPVRAKQERRAEEWAAMRLIDVDDYRRLEWVHDGHAGAIALDLGIMRSTVDTFRGMLARIGNDTYLDPRMGAGQWRARIEVA